MTYSVFPPAWRPTLDELRPTLRLALPVILGELGWMGLVVVDTMMVGRVGAASIGAVGIGRAVMMTVAVFGMGLLLGLDTLVSSAWGAGRADEARRWLHQGVWLAAAASLPLALLFRLAGSAVEHSGVNPEVVAAMRPYVRALSWSVTPLLLYTALRRYLQGVGRVRPVMIALISANAVHALADWILIFGKLGAPALGAAGAGWSTCIACWYLALFLGWAALLHVRREPAGPSPGWRLDRARQRRLIGLGLPAACQLVAEVAVFATATALVGRLAPEWLAGHQIALTVVSVTFMVPLGFSSAGAVRVGHAIGRGAPRAATEAGWAAWSMAGLFMLLPTLAFILAPQLIASAFTADPSVARAGAALLRIGAAFQLFDGIQVVSTGILRGIGDTRTPLWWNLVGHWALGLPAGYLLCFPGGWGARGLWCGWLVGLGVVAVMLTRTWAHRTRRDTMDSKCEP
jgi:multidrug resistance protein, MATE family